MDIEKASLLFVFIVFFLFFAVYVASICFANKRYGEKMEKRFDGHADYVNNYLGKEISFNEIRRGVDYSEIGVIFSMASELGFESVFNTNFIKPLFSNHRLFDHPRYNEECALIVSAYIARFGSDNKVVYVEWIK